MGHPKNINSTITLLNLLCIYVPHYDEALANGWRIERVRTNVGFLAVRVLHPEKDVELGDKVKVYPYSERANPKANPIHKPKAGDETYFIRPPAGMAYWEQLNENIYEKIGYQITFACQRYGRWTLGP